MDANESPVDDKTANNNDGTANGSAAFATTDPPDTGDGTASNYQTGYWTFTGNSTDYIDFGSGSSLNVTGETFSTVMWIYENISGWKYWSVKYTTSPSQSGWRIGIDNGVSLEFNVYGGGTRYQKNGANPSENQWEHVAYTLASDDTMCTYLNGTSNCGTVTGANITSTSSIAYPFGTEILRACQHAIFTDTLTSTEVNDIKDNGLGYSSGVVRRVSLAQ